MNKSDKKLSFNGLWHDIFLMGGGTALAEMINVLAQPILTRLVPAEQLGVYTYIVSLATMIIPIASLKLDLLIVSEEDEHRAQLVTDLSFEICVGITSIYALIIFVGYVIPVGNIFNQYGLVIFLVPVLVFTNGLRFLFISYNNRYKKYKVISLVAILREGVRAVIQVLSGIFHFGTVGLSLGYAVAPLVGLRIQMKDYLSNLKQRKRINKAEAKDILRNDGKRQIVYLVPAQFINSFSASLITISISSLFDAASLGYYSAGVRILDIPILFISSNVSKVCYQRISEDVKNHKPILKLLLTIIGVIGGVSFLGFGILYFIAPPLAEFVFGSGYGIAGEYIKCLCLMYAMRLVGTSFAGVYTVFKRQNYELILNVLLIVMAGTAYLATSFLSMDIFAYLRIISVGYAVVYMLMLGGYIVLGYQHDHKLSVSE